MPIPFVDPEAFGGPEISEIAMKMSGFNAASREKAKLRAAELRAHDVRTLVAELPELDDHASSMVAARLDAMPKAMRAGYLRAMTGSRPKSAMRAFCLMCVGWVRAEVDGCTDPACPLFPYRPSTPAR